MSEGVGRVHKHRGVAEGMEGLTDLSMVHVSGAAWEGAVLARRMTASEFASHAVTDDAEAVFAAAIELLDLAPSDIEVAAFRAAVRRLRADLRTFRPVLDNGWVDDLRVVLLGLDQRAENFEAFDTAVRHSKELTVGNRRLRTELTICRDEALRALVATVLHEMQNGWMLHRLVRRGAVVGDGEAARSTVGHVLPGCLRRLWRQITSAGAPTMLDDIVALAVLAEKGAYAAEASVRALGEPASRLASSCRDLGTLLSPTHRLATALRVVPSLLPQVPASQVAQRIEQFARAEWTSIAHQSASAIAAVRAAEDATRTPVDGRTIRAGGGVVWRATADDVEVLLVHRYNRTGWSLPKGKCHLGESDEACAVREVEEETGLTCSLGHELPSVEYLDRNGRPKIVRYWVMDTLAGEPRPAAEVDEVRWHSLAEAREVVAKDRDRKVLDALELPVVAR